MVTEDCHVAATLRSQLAAELGQQRFDLWFGQQARFLLTEHSLTVFTACVFTRDWLCRNFADVVRDCCQKLTGRDVRVEFEVDESIPAAHSKGVLGVEPALDTNHVGSAADTSVDGHVNLRNKTAVSSRSVASSESQPQGPDFSLSGFVVGPGNEYAYGAATMTARGLQQASPLLLHGPTGVGKTHLLRSIRAEYRRHRPRARALYLTAEQFTTSYIEAVRGSGMPSFRQKCRGTDLLLVDDLQFFAGKRASLEEFQYTLDTLLGEGRQVVLSCDRTLAELRALGSELVSRLAGGLQCEIQPPDYATRVKLVHRLSADLAIAIDDDVASMVATQVTLGARELRGALYRLRAVGQICRRPITRQLVAAALTELAQHCTRQVRLPDVEHAICDVFGVEPAQLRSDRKSRAIQEPRMLAMWLARKYTRAPWSEIGQFFGRRSHSTVISAHRKMERLIRAEAEIGLNDKSCRIEEAIRRVEAALRTA